MAHDVNAQRLIAARGFVFFFLCVSFILLIGNVTRLRAQVSPIGAAAQASATNTITSFTAVAGTNRVLIVTASDAASTNITSVTFNGNPMTERAESQDGFAVDAIYTLPLGTSASSATGNIVITSTNASHGGKVVFARVFENVDQTTPLTSILATNGLIIPSSDTLTVTSATGDLVFDIFDTFRISLPGSAHLAGSGQTIMHTVSEMPIPGVNGGFGWYSTSTKAGAAGVAMSRRTTDHTALIHIAANIKQAVPFAIGSTVPPANGTFSLPGPFTFDVNFNSPLNPATVQTSDLSLSGIAGAFVTGVTVLPGNTTLQFTISGISIEGTLSASISAGAVTDVSGNPNPAFAAGYFVRQPITVFPYFHTFPVGTNWTVNQSSPLWQLAIATGPRGSTDTVAKADFYNVGAGNVAYLMSPPMDLPVIPNPGTGGALVMHFHVAYRAYTGGENDSLAVVLSTDGGLTFPNELWVKSRNSAPSLATLSQSSASFTPTAASDWRYETVVLSAYSGQSNVVIAFRANSRFGNDCFIDNVRIDLAQNLTVHTVNGAGSYAGDGGVSVFFSSFGSAQENPVQNNGQNVSMNFDGSPIAISVPGEKASRLNIPDVVTASSQTSSNIPGGTLYIASYTGRPPTTSPIEFEQNTTAFTHDFSVFTPNNISDNRWWTVTYSGDDSIRAFWSEKIDYTQLPGVSLPQKLYIMERNDRDTSWVARSTTITVGRGTSITGGTYITRSSLRRGFVDVAVGSRTEYNPGIWNQLKGNVRVMLQGPYGGGASPLKIAGATPMNTALKANGILAARFGSNVPATAVDSIAVEIRNAPTAAASTIRQIQPAWLLRYGEIVNFSDTTKDYIEFGGAPNGNYYLAVWHRSHLGIMSATPQPLTTGVPAEYNFTTAQSQAYGTNPMVQVESGVYAMYAGDANTSNTITNADVIPVFDALSASGYLPGDINLTGFVTAADANLVLTNLNVSGQVTKPAGANTHPIPIRKAEVQRKAAVGGN